MDHQRWIKRSLISTAVAASICLTACGGSGDGAVTGDIGDTVDTMATLSGKVADGYLLNAAVCLDLNLSKTCDSGEPTATSTSGGNYSLEATQAQIDTYPVIAEIIAGTTIDEDNPGVPVTKAYTLTAPAGKGAFVSPLSTMVQAQIETTGKTAEQIESEILASIGQDPAVVSLFDDYVASKTDTANSAAVKESYLQLHQIAQVTASAIADNLELIEAAVTSGEITMDLTTTLDSLITIIVKNVIEELTAISIEIDNAASFDANTIATAAVPPVNTDAIEDQVAVAEAAANAAVATNLEAIFTAGINWLWAEFSDWDSDELERSTISYDATTGKIAEPIESYFATSTPGWTLLPSETDDLVLQADGTWKPVVDSWDGSPASFDNTAGTASIDSPWGMEKISNFKASDLTGLDIKQFVANKLPDLASFIDPDSVFTTGAEAYSLNLTSLEDSYSIWVWDDCGGGIQYVNGNCNTVVNYSSQGSTSIYNSLISLPVATAFDPSNPSNNGHFHDLGSVDPNISPYQSMYFEIVKGATNAPGVTNYYLLTFGDSTSTYTKVGTGTWSIITVNGAELLMVDHPDELISQYSHVASHLDSPEENSFFAMHDGVVRQGSHWPANILENTAESLVTNQQAQMEITDAFLDASVINATPSGDLACDTASDWNKLFNGPWTLYSFADFEAVVIACGGAQTVDANTLLGGNISQSYTMINGAMFQFDQGNTGFYMAPTTGNTPQDFAPINWTIDPATNYITVDDPAGSFRFTLAVIAIDSSVSPALFTIKQYIEEAGGSDMIRDQGSDGQIVDLTFQQI